MRMLPNGHFGSFDHSYSHWLGSDLPGGMFELSQLLFLPPEAAASAKRDATPLRLISHCTCGEYHVQVTLTSCAAGDMSLVFSGTQKYLFSSMDRLIMRLKLEELVLAYSRSLPKASSCLIGPSCPTFL